MRLRKLLNELRLYATRNSIVPAIKEHVMLQLKDKVMGMNPADEDSLMDSVLTTDWVFKTYVTASSHVLGSPHEQEADVSDIVVATATNNVFTSCAEVKAQGFCVHRQAKTACRATCGDEASVSGDQVAGCTYVCKDQYQQSSAPACDVLAVCFCASPAVVTLLFACSTVSLFIVLRIHGHCKTRPLA